MKAESLYIAIIGDLRHSRRVKDRAGLQNRLIETVAGLNASSKHPGLNGALSAPIAMTAGDEVQALVVKASAVAEIIESLANASRPAIFTFGIGLGMITTQLNPNVALIDGPAFHKARSALHSARSDGSWGAAFGFDDDDTPITAVLGLMGAIRVRWTDRQMHFMRLVRSRKSQTEIARHEDISPSVISESLRTMALVQYGHGQHALTELMSRHLPDSDT